MIWCLPSHLWPILVVLSSSPSLRSLMATGAALLRSPSLLPAGGGICPVALHNTTIFTRHSHPHAHTSDTPPSILSFPPPPPKPNPSPHAMAPPPSRDADVAKAKKDASSSSPPVHAGCPAAAHPELGGNHAHARGLPGSFARLIGRGGAAAGPPGSSIARISAAGAAGWLAAGWEWGNPTARAAARLVAGMRPRSCRRRSRSSWTESGQRQLNRKEQHHKDIEGC